MRQGEEVIGSGVRCAGCFDRTTVRVARRRPEQKREPASPATIRGLPMQLQVGDRLAAATGEWEVIGRPYMTAAGKNALVRHTSRQPRRDDDSDLGRA